MRKSDFTRLIGSNDFRELFITHLGWNRWRGSSRLLPIAIDDTEYQFQTVADRNGLQVVVAEVDELPGNSLVRKIDNQLRRQAQDYISIYVLRREPKHHLWVVPLKNVDKRDLVSLEYLDAAHADFLFSKIDDIEFSPADVTTIVDVKEAVHRAFFVNSEKITKDFYAGFKKQHAAFAKFITGIDDEIAVKDNRNKQWYASVMLNRLMFCYFIQKKGFLDGNVNYLRDKLRDCIAERGRNQFFSTFYLGFLRRLFSDGLNQPKHDREFERQFGRIPYLNGGMFDRHQIEREYTDIDIADDAFVSLFEFFDKWQWHLDTRVTASGRDINPDVLGYIFEQYINDRAQMGAYYTKEDITEYIGRNTILPFLFDRIAHSSKTVETMFAPDGWVWQTLKMSGDRYLFDAVKQGWTADWRQRIPQEIAVGLDTETPDLLARRARWNDRTPEPFALPTEIWRETIERLQRVDSIMAKISAGEITSINDFITYNLDIRLFASDLVAKSDSGSFVYSFYDALRSVTVLDPTCGSGAFLFAAMNILEPLYYECIMRMKNDFKDNLKVNIALDEISAKYRSNIHYFIYKSIILRNLYGVDIMVEATEIAKLRLFLKMVAVVDVDYRADNLGLDPLPDIDFNIRCGNTLVGYANVASVASDHSGDMFAAAEFEDKIKGEMDTVARVFKTFKRLQLTQETEHHAEFVEAKHELTRRLATLNDTLNHHLHNATASGIPYNKWLKSHQPFNWVAEFYEIIHGNGGFDVIIGNPPYVSMSKINYLDKPSDFKCSDLYAYVIKRVYDILNSVGRHGFIVMHNLAFSRNFKDLRRFFRKMQGTCWWSFYSRIPSGLFSGDVRVRNTIYIWATGQNLNWTTRLHRWFTEQREYLFKTTSYNSVSFEDCIPMMDNSILQKVYSTNHGIPIAYFIDKHGIPMYIKSVAYNSLGITPTLPPSYNEFDKEIQAPGIDIVKWKSNMFKILNVLFLGKLYFAKWLIWGDDFHYTSSDLTDFSYPFDKLTTEDIKCIEETFDNIKVVLPQLLQYKLNAGINVGSYNTKELWTLTDKTDLIFLSHLTDNPLKVFHAIDQQVWKSVITDRK